MEVMVNTVVLSTDRAWTRFEIVPGRPTTPLKTHDFGKRVKGIEPSRPAWEAGVLPLNYTRKRELPMLETGWSISKRRNHCQDKTSSDA
jgi:hypothetical protein